MKFSVSAFLHAQPTHLLVDPAMVFFISSFLAGLSWTGKQPSALQLLHPHPPSAEGIFSRVVLCWRLAMLFGKINIYHWTAHPELCAVIVAVACRTYYCTSQLTALVLVLLRRSHFLFSVPWCWFTLCKVTRRTVQRDASALLGCLHVFLTEFWLSTC